jgi:hypothetical protein
MDFDGEEFKPRGSLSLPQVFEIPSLQTLIKNRSQFQLVSHNMSTKVDTVVSDGTDISIEVDGEVSREWLQLYRSHTTREQRNFLTTHYLSAPDMSPILRDVLLARYCRILGIDGSDSYNKLEVTIAATIEKNEFDSGEERRLAAYYLYSKAAMSSGQSMWRDAYKSYLTTTEVLWPLVSSGVPSIRDATMLHLSLRRMVESWQRQKSFKNAETMSEALIKAARLVKDSDPTEPDFQRMWANALLLDAVVNAELQKEGLTIAGLVEHVEVLRHLYIKLQTPARQLAWVESMSTSIKIVSTRKISADREVEAWEAALSAEIVNDKVLPSPTELPVWLKDCTLRNWPTKPIKSATLRYSLRIPEQWSADKTVSGVESLTTHLYHGNVGCDAEWLIISFMENVDEHNDMTNWVGGMMAFTGFPVLCDSKVKPKLLPGSWQYMGHMPSLTLRLKADETHAYMGVARFEASRPMLGRIYLVLARKGTFAWNVALSFQTACMPGTSEERLNSNDHNRAGAILGTLQLDGI